MSETSIRQRSVLHLIDTTGPGGAETVFLQVADGLRRRGWDPHAAVVGTGWVLDNLQALDIRTDVVPTRGRMDVGFLRGLRDIVRRREIVLIHAHLFSPAVYASAVGLWTGTPVIATFHGASDIQAGDWARGLRYRLIDRQANVACVSDSLRDALEALGSIRMERVSVIPNGVDLDRFRSADGAALRRAYGVRDEQILVGAVGNVRPAKDYHTFLRAAAAMAQDERFVFLVVGEQTQPLYGELLALRHQLGLDDRVHFTGFREDVPNVMAALDTLAISSSSEGFSLAAIQAMTAGTPVVATRSGGPEGIITDGRDGLLVPTASPPALADAIRQVNADSTLRARITAAARSTVAERFSLEAMLDRYERLYSGVVGRPREADPVTLAAR